MSTFLFVAGGWHGGWSWKRVAGPLRSAGHDVYTPTLTGLGDRAHLMSEAVDLETHVADITGVIQWDDLQEVNLVGHSYGGMIITAVADQMPERVASLVYLDALWPVDGESVCDVIGEEAVQNVVAAQADPSNPPLILGGAELAKMLGVTEPGDVAWMASKLTPQPPGSMTQAIRLTGAGETVPVLFVACNETEFEGPELSLARAKERAAVSDDVRVVTLRAPHNAMVTHPREVVDLLTEQLDLRGERAPSAAYGAA